MPNKDDDNYISKADLESAIQKVRTENDTQDVTVNVTNVNGAPEKPLVEKEKPLVEEEKPPVEKEKPPVEKEKPLVEKEKSFESVIQKVKIVNASDIAKPLIEKEKNLEKPLVEKEKPLVEEEKSFESVIQKAEIDNSEKPLVEKEKPLVEEEKSFESIIQKVKIDNADAIADPLIEEEKKKALKQLEESIERKERSGDLLNGLSEIGDAIIEGFKELTAMLAKTVSNSLSGFLIGAFLTFAAVVARFDSIVNPMRKLVDRLRKFSQWFTTKKTKFLGGLGTKISNWFKSLRRLDKIVASATMKKVNKGITKFKRFFEFVGFHIELFAERIRKLMKLKIFQSKVWVNLVKTARFFNKYVGLFGGLLKKIFWPITILFSIFAFIKGFMRGYKEDGIIGGLTEGIIETFDFLVGSIARILGWLVKHLLIWLGFDKLAAQVSPALESVINVIYDIFRGLVNVVVGVFTFDGARFMKGGDKIREAIESMISMPVVYLGAIGAVLLKNLRSMGKTKFLASLWTPLQNLFGVLRTFGRNMKAIKLKGFRKISKAFPKISKFFKFIGTVFKTLFRFVKIGGSVIRTIMKPLTSVLRVFGKLFLPITILMSVFDFVKGFMKGYAEGGIIGGITEGIVSVFDGLIGSLMRLLGWIPKKLLELLGLDNLAAMVMPLIDTYLDGIKNTFRGLIDIVVGIFTLDGSKIMGGLKKIWDSILGYLSAPFLVLGAFFKDLFGVDPFEGIKETFGKVIQAVMDVFNSLKESYFNLIRKIPGMGWVLDKLGVGDKNIKEAEVNLSVGTKKQNSTRAKMTKVAPKSMSKDYTPAKPGGRRGGGSRNSNSQTNNNVSQSVSYNIQGNTNLASDALNFATT